MSLTRRQTDRGAWTSASNALADRLCRGRHQAQNGLPELPQTEESQAGSVLHAVWTATRPAREPGPEEMEKAQALAEQEALVAREFFRNGEELVRRVEHRLWHQFPAWPDEPARGLLKTSGQFDVALVHPESRRALLLDGKSGWLPVTPNPSNLQLRRLAALLWLELGCREIGVCILKPFGRTEPPCVYDEADLEQSLLEMEEDVRQSHAPNAVRTAGTQQCRYCRAREGCPARLSWLAAVLPSTSPALPMVSARDWSPAQRALFLEREKDARDWLEARKEEIKVLLAEAPESVPGYYLKPGRLIETITDPQQVWTRFNQNLGGTLDLFIKTIKVGKTALKEQVRVLTGRKGRALDRDLESLLAGCVECKPSAATIEKLE